MTKIFDNYKNLIGLLLVVVLAVALFNLGMSGPVCFALVASWQLLQFARSPRLGACYTGTLTEQQIKEFQRVMDQVDAGWKAIKDIPDRVKGLERENDEMRGQLKRLNKMGLASLGHSGVRWIGDKPFVSDDCAAAITAVFVLGCARLENGLEHLVADAAARERIKSHASGILGMEMKAAMTGTEIPLPTTYVPQVIELVFKYGVARQYATMFPLGSGTVKMPRLKAGEDDFTYFGAGTAGMSQSITEKRVAAELVTFTANKCGGLIRLPSELEEDSFIPVGQFLARYIARQLAKLEDKTLFLADGTATYASQTGVGPYCVANPTYLLQLAGGKTKPSDATLADWRNVRGKVSAAVLSGAGNAAYYINPTFEPMLRAMNAYPNFIVYDTSNPGKPTFDGWPVRWVGNTQSYLTTAAPSSFIGFFGDLSYWFLGERGTPRLEVSREVFFATDELAMRALERIDVEALAIDAMSALQTAAA
jgi:HK97 family phage major capsid protein